jgi:hypothetical protein
MRLEIYQSMWGMERLPMNTKVEWTLEQQVDMIAGAGFAGAGVEFLPAAPEPLCSMLIERELRISAHCFPKTVADLEPVLDSAAALGPHVDHVNLQPNVRPHTVLECIPYVLGWQELGRQAGVKLFFETHRDRMTTDLLFTLQLMDAVPSMRMTADLSHFLVGREFAWPVSDVDHGLIRRVLARTSAYHGRVASREQVQIQIGFPHHRGWLDLFAGWWLEGFRMFIAGAAADDVLTFMPELGPPEWYAITGPDGEELSDRWLEALELRDLAVELWQRAVADGAVATLHST